MLSGYESRINLKPTLLLAAVQNLLIPIFLPPKPRNVNFNQSLATFFEGGHGFNELAGLPPPPPKKRLDPPVTMLLLPEALITIEPSFHPLFTGKG